MDDAPAGSRETLAALGMTVATVNGCDDCQAADADVVRTIMTNYVNHLVDTGVDLPEVPPLD